MRPIRLFTLCLVRGKEPQHLPQTLLRLSVGIEAVEDLWTDLDRALQLHPSP